MSDDARRAGALEVAMNKRGHHFGRTPSSRPAIGVLLAAITIGSAIGGCGPNGGGANGGATNTTSAPTVTAVSPDYGSTAGGTRVKITGAHFAGGGTTVSFGSAPALDVQVSNSTELSATTPPGSAGVVSPAVNVGGQTATLADGYAYTKAVDVHLHLAGSAGGDFGAAAGAAVQSLDLAQVSQAILTPPPFSDQASQAGAIYEGDAFTSVFPRYPGRFAFLGGGGSLNVQIQQAVHGASIDPEAFKSKARQLAALTGFVGFGEMAALHFSLHTGHPFQVAPADHPLFKALVDVASEQDVPIDLHMEAVPADMPFPTLVSGGSSANPSTLSANIPAFAGLLAYARTKTPPVKILWDHCGWDNTKARTPTLTSQLFSQNDNLYVSIKQSPDDSPVDTRVLDASGNVRADWLAVMNQYSARFLIGADQFFVSPGGQALGPPSFTQTWDIAGKLPASLAFKLIHENPRAVYRKLK